MHDRGTLKHHAELFDRMAEAAGVDLMEHAIAGDITIDEISDAVLACAACSNPGHCARVLADAAQTGIPGYCRNGDLLCDLAAVRA